MGEAREMRVNPGRGFPPPTFVRDSLRRQVDRSDGAMRPA
jgi:hypothetical protein